MLKQIIFTVTLALLCVFSFYVGLKPIGPLAAWQEKETPKKEAKTETEESSKWLTIKIQWKSVHKSLDEKTSQFQKAWGTVKTVQGNINILHSTDVRAVYPVSNPLEVLTPVISALNKISNLFRWSLAVLLLEKMLLVVSVPLVCLVLIPICSIKAIYHVWTYNDKRSLHKVIITAVMISAILLLAVPLTLRVSLIIDEKVFAPSVNTVMSSMEGIDKSATAFNRELREFRRSESAINGYLSTSNRLSDAAVKDGTKYLLIFLMVNILLPVGLFILIYKLTRYYVKKILR